MNIIKELRKNLDITQSEFCEKSGLKLQTYQKIEQSESVLAVRSSTMQVIADTLMVSVEFIINSQIKEIVRSFSDIELLKYTTFKQIANVCTVQELEKYYNVYKNKLIKKAILECKVKENTMKYSNSKCIYACIKELENTAIICKKNGEYCIDLGCCLLKTSY